MDEVKEQQQIAEEISNAISHPIGFGHDVDEDELLKVICNIEMRNWTNEFFILNLGIGRIRTRRIG